MSVVFGKVPHPTAKEDWCVDKQNTAWDNLGQRSVKGVVLHRMIGTLWGTSAWFKQGAGKSPSLTDYGVGVASIDGTINDGLILRWNDPTGAQRPGCSPNRSGWASGPVNKSYGNGKAFLDDCGSINCVNRDQASIEISGNYDTPLSSKALESIAALIAYWADQAKIPWNVFPTVPGKTYSFVRWHQEFTIGTGKICPGPVVMKETPVIIERARQIMKIYQGAGQEEFVKPGDFPAYDGTDKKVNAKTFWACSRIVTVVDDTLPSLQFAGPDAKHTRAPYKKGDNVEVIYAVLGFNDQPYWVTKDGSRLLMSGTTPRASFAK